MHNNLAIIGVEPTALFSAKEPLRQLAHLKLVYAEGNEISAAIRVAMDETGQRLESYEILKEGYNYFNIWIPDIMDPVTLSIQITDRNDSSLLAEWNGRWKPQRKWKVYIIKSSHYDMGYDGRVDHMQAEAAVYMDLAKRMCTFRFPNTGWHYYLEHMGFIRAYERERKETDLRKLIEDCIKTGGMTLLGNPSGPHWHWMDYEQIARAPYPARREMMDRFGLDVKSVAVVDNPNISWSAFQAFAKSGFKYVFRLSNPYRPPVSFKELGIPRICRIECPNSEDRILCCFADHYYDDIWVGHAGGIMGSYVDLAADEMSRYLMKVERGELFGEYPYDTLIVSNYSDWKIPNEDAMLHGKWKNDWKYPEIHFEDASKAMNCIEDKYHDIIPTLRGDTNNHSADYSSIDPVSQGIKRRATRLLPYLEGLNAIASRFGAGIQYSGKSFSDLYINLVEYDEHCWPTMISTNDMNIFNTSVVKTNRVKRVHSKVSKQLKTCMQAILGNTDVSEETGSSEETRAGSGFLSVWNPLAHTRSDLVKMGVDKSICRILNSNGNQVIVAEDEQGKSVSIGQMLESGEVAFILKDVPAYGFRNLKLNVQEIDTCRGGNLSGLTVSDEDNRVVMQNEFYRLCVCKTDGRVTTLEDKKMNCQLIDREAPYAFNQWLRVTTGEFNYASAAKEAEITPLGNSIAYLGQAGPVMAQVVVETTDIDAGARIISTYTLYAGLDRIDINNNVLSMDFLHTPASDRYKENVFVSFPFNIRNPRFRIEYSTGTVDPVTDLLPSIHDFMMLNRWVDVNDENHGITMISHEAAAVNLGRIMYNRFSTDYVPEKSHIYSYAWSNRMAGLIALGPEDYKAEFSYSIRSHAGDWIKGKAASFGWEQSSPLIAEIVPGRIQENGYDYVDVKKNSCSFVSIDRDNIQMTVLKRAERPGSGFVIRVVETEGKENTDLKITVSFIPVVKAWLCDLVENDTRELQVNNGVIELPVGKYDMATIRFTGPHEAFFNIKQFDAIALGDSEVKLEWEFFEDIRCKMPGINIYRSEDPGYNPTMHSMIAYTEGVEYIDKGLKPGCKYYYYVAPANRDNLQGDIVGPVYAVTTLQNLTPPLPVEELGVIPMDVDRLAVYWRKSIEPDIACYKIYRGDTPEFSASEDNLAAVVEPDDYWYQLYMDTGLKAGVTKYYKVFPVDYAGNVQQTSECVCGRTPLMKRLEGTRNAPWVVPV